MYEALPGGDDNYGVLDDIDMDAEYDVGDEGEAGSINKPRVNRKKGRGNTTAAAELDYEIADMHAKRVSGDADYEAYDGDGVGGEPLPVSRRMKQNGSISTSTLRRSEATIAEEEEYALGDNHEMAQAAQQRRPSRTRQSTLRQLEPMEAEYALGDNNESDDVAVQHSSRKNKRHTLQLDEAADEQEYALGDNGEHDSPAINRYGTAAPYTGGEEENYALGDNDDPDNEQTGQFGFDDGKDVEYAMGDEQQGPYQQARDAEVEYDVGDAVNPDYDRDVEYATGDGNGADDGANQTAQDDVEYDVGDGDGYAETIAALRSPIFDKGLHEDSDGDAMNGYVSVDD